ncbi:MAG TPA: hypothetical protein VEV82_06900 [Actinomycetota bacterium]|nr:hypothetical protein [Actinomycetota bacterium]
MADDPDAGAYVFTKCQNVANNPYDQFSEDIGGYLVFHAGDFMAVTLGVDKVAVAEFGKVINARSRDISFNLNQHLIAKGEVSSGFNACFQKVRIDIQKLKNGNWDKVKSDKTTNGGNFSIGLTDSPGKYRAMAPKFLVNEANSCKAATSRARTHKH